MKSLSFELQPITLKLTIQDPEVLQALHTKSPGDEQEAYALRAMRVGVLSFMNARGQIDIDGVRSATGQMIANIGSAMSETGQEVMKDFKRELSPGNPEGPMADFLREQSVRDEERDKKDTAYKEQVLSIVVGDAARSEERDRSTRHGDDFEADVGAFLESFAANRGDIVDETGKKPGEIDNRKVGDYVYKLGPDQRAAGSRIVVEAKEDKSYTLKRALKEIEFARKKRRAGAGIFVFSAKTAPGELIELSRFGDDVVVVWDSRADNEINMRAALSVATALVAVTFNDSEDVDREEIEASVSRVEVVYEHLNTMAKSVRTSKKAMKTIEVGIENIRDGVTEEVEALREAISRSA